MKRGYARVSSEGQNLDRQIVKLKEVGCEIIYEDKLSGGNRYRPALERLLNEVGSGDEIWIHELSRFSRSLKDMLDLINEIKEKGASLHSISEKWLDTSEDNPSSQLLLNIFGSLAQFEREMIKMRQQEGIALAKKRGVYKGRMRKYTENNQSLLHALELYESSKKTIKQIEEITGVSKSTLYRVANQKGIKRS